MDLKNGIRNWSTADAAEMYGIDNWGHGFFDLSEKGEVRVKLPWGGGEKRVSLLDIIDGIEARGYGLPVLLRFPDILGERIRTLNESFAKTMKQYEYRGAYRGVFPIKVNQQQQVIEEVVRFGGAYHHGLEAGSKPELLIALGMVRDPETPIICNGYKDEEFVDLALYGVKMGLQVILVIEQPGEISTIIRRSKKLGIEPTLGLRVKLSSTVGGKWAESAGDHSVFGLTAGQLVDAIEELSRADMLGTLRLLHYHLGSQIPNIRDIRSAVHEASRYYTALVHEGAPMGYLDIGGGLGVDYDGSRTTFVSSKNYSLDEYCSDVVDVIKMVMDEAGVEHPTVVTESGRATVAYYSVLLFNILDVNSLHDKELPDAIPEEAPEALTNMLEAYKGISIKNLQESYHDIIYYRDELRNLFMVGNASLRDRSVGDSIFWLALDRIVQLSRKMRFIPDELQKVESMLADIYYGNFSLFQSVPDNWAIDQLFPIMPIHRLNEEPDRRGVLADITCDCDGKIDHFIDLYGMQEYLPLHSFSPESRYVIGTFLVGAYQETLGDLHNLFGDTNIVSVALDEEGEIACTREVEGDSVSDVLSYVEYDPKRLIEGFRHLAENAVRKKSITPYDRKEIMKAYIDGMQGYTYYEV
ncbi:biosynthetic arginine decarboxylase [Sediminispirochaeta smaragdinae]|jgi:arginine decarboxylase|uniref:Biosynthetic arginine decarboxylase n=1 Tax=Sediminispirochaeta smaragdinae (strain DSM 11293 / JCM 15392 / SEBR 4228) TaxID=573413 RepID=E1RAI5_SEDSS|nr:biosynthetic arginine decarboxylase [Sediminispirochaeta smaragdinae]ADK82353.1 arginine decarboxylase [Sediminispirochaeta smaragdinae DSM 11293]